MLLGLFLFSLGLLLELLQLLLLCSLDALDVLSTLLLSLVLGRHSELLDRQGTHFLSDARLVLDKVFSEAGHHLLDHADGVGAVIRHLASLGNQLDEALEHHLLRKWVLDGINQLLKLSNLS